MWRTHKDWSRENLPNNELYHPGGPHSKNKKTTKNDEKRNKFLHHARELKKLWNMRVTVIPVVIGAPGTIPKGLVMEAERVRNQRMSRHHPNDITEISHNTEKCPGDLKRLVKWNTIS